MEKQIQDLYTPLFLYVRKRINNLEDAEDLTQEIFYKLSKSNSDTIDDVKSWVYTIAKNTITDYYRKRKVYTENIDENTFEEAYNDHNVVTELSSCISAYVKELPTEYRSIMTLSELKDISQKEIAKKLNMNYVTVRSKIQRGRKLLKNIFSDCCTINQGAKGSIIDYQKKNGCSNKENDCSENKNQGC